MQMLTSIHEAVAHFHAPILLTTGGVLLSGYYFGKSATLIKLPSIIGYMILGLLLGPSVLGVMDGGVQVHLSFLTELALGFVALSIGLELNLQSLKRQGWGIISIILCESFAAFALTTLAIYLLTKDWPLSIIFGAFAPASAPAGTVAVIKECRARGSLTKALYAVVGFDDGLAIVIFGFAAAVARMLLLNEADPTTELHMLEAVWKPTREIVFSLGTGAVLAMAFSFLALRLRSKSELLIVIVAFVLIANGLCSMLHLSVILTNMVVGLIVVNARPGMTQRLSEVLGDVMPLFFVLFFALAGSSLRIDALGSVGWIGVVYIVARSVGLMGGAALGGTIGSVEHKVKKYVGMGILSQAGVAIGLALIVQHEFMGLGRVVDVVDGHSVHAGDLIGSYGITSIAATCVFFEVIGPILTRVALGKAGEIRAP